MVDNDKDDKKKGTYGWIVLNWLGVDVFPGIIFETEEVARKHLNMEMEGDPELESDNIYAYIFFKL